MTEWISVKDRLPTKEEYITLWSDGQETLSRILIAYMTDTIEYEIGCYDGYKWMNKYCTKTISDVIAWKKFVPYIPDFDKNDMTKMFMNVDKLEEIPAGSLFDCLTEKQKARAKRKGYRSVKLDRFLDKLPISQKFADVIRDIYWRC